MDSGVQDINNPYLWVVIQIEKFYKENKMTTPIQVDMLVVIYRITENERCFNILYKCHKFLLMKLVQDSFNLYKRHLYSEDFNDLYMMAFGEFYRRVLKYTIPPIAPFSKYIKLYMKKWLNAYVKLMVKRNGRTILNCDRNIL